MDLLLYFLTASPSLFCLFTLLPHRLSLSDSIKETGIQTQIRWFFRDTSLSSSQSAGFLNKVVFFASTPRLRFIGLSCGEQSELGLGNTSNHYSSNSCFSPSPSLHYALFPQEKVASRTSSLPTLATLGCSRTAGGSTLPLAVPVNESWWGALGVLILFLQKQTNNLSFLEKKKIFLIIQIWIDSIGKKYGGTWKLLYLICKKWGAIKCF